MNLKKMIILNAILTFLLCFLTHFMYDLCPNAMFAVFFPVNESIWEHMKMLYTTILLYGFIEHFIMKKYHIDFNNFLLTTLIKAIVAIPLYLLLFLPFFYNFGENMIYTFIILFTVILIVNFMGEKILMMKPIKYQKEISIIFIILIYIIMTILTYLPPRSDIFFDTEEAKYGIDDYLIKD